MILKIHVKQLKGRSEMKILSFTHPHVSSRPIYFLLWNTKGYVRMTASVTIQLHSMEKNAMQVNSDLDFQSLPHHPTLRISVSECSFFFFFWSGDFIPNQLVQIILSPCINSKQLCLEDNQCSLIKLNITNYLGIFFFCYN